MKKYLTVMFIAFMFLSLCACEKGNNPGPESHDSEPQIPVPGGDDTYTEADFNLKFEDFDGRDLNITDGTALSFESAFGLWEGLITKHNTGEFAERELCLINIYKDGERVIMNIDSRLKDEDGHIGESNHHFDPFEMTESGEHPVFKLYGMYITIESVTEKDGVQYLFARMDNDINESFDIVMFRNKK